MATKKKKRSTTTKRATRTSNDKTTLGVLKDIRDLLVDVRRDLALGAINAKLDRVLATVDASSPTVPVVTAPPSARPTASTAMVSLEDLQTKHREMQQTPSLGQLLETLGYTGPDVDRRLALVDEIGAMRLPIDDLVDLPPRIAADPAVCHGKPVIKGTRVMVATVVGNVGAGQSIDEVAVDYGVTREDVLAAIGYAAGVVAGRRPLSRSILAIDDDIVSPIGDGRRPPSTGLFVSVDNKPDDESEPFGDLEK
jgi:uncharacterized protein (DUF433 family)